MCVFMWILTKLKNKTVNCYLTEKPKAPLWSECKSLMFNNEHTV